MEQLNGKWESRGREEEVGLWRGEREERKGFGKERERKKERF